MFLAFSVAGVFIPPVGGQVFYGILLILSTVWCVQTARMALVIDQNGITERSMGRPRRTPWQDVEEVAIRAGRWSSGADYWLIVLRLRDGRVLSVDSTVSSDRKSVEDIGRRIVVMRTAGLGAEDAADLAVIEGDPDEKYGKPLGGPVVGPDGVPVMVRLRGPGGVDLNWGATALLDGLVIGLVAVVLIGVGGLVSVIVRRVRKKPGYRLHVEVGAPERRSVTLPFDSRLRAAKYARDLTDAISKYGAAVVPRTSEAQ